MAVGTSTYPGFRSLEFLFYKASAAQTLAANTWEKLLVPTKIIDEGDLLSNSRLVAPTISRWQINCHVPIDAVAGAASIALAVAKNGVLDLQLNQVVADASTQVTLVGSAIITLAATNHIEIWVRKTVAGPTIHSGSVFTWLQLVELP